MDQKDLKKLLAGLSLTGLLTSAGLGICPPTAHGGSGWSGKDTSAGSAEIEEKKGGSGWSGKDEGAVGTDEEKEEKEAKKEKEKGGSAWAW